MPEFSLRQMKLHSLAWMLLIETHVDRDTLYTKYCHDLVGKHPSHSLNEDTWDTLNDRTSNVLNERYRVNFESTRLHPYPRGNQIYDSSVQRQFKIICLLLILRRCSQELQFHSDVNY